MLSGWSTSTTTTADSTRRTIHTHSYLRACKSVANRATKSCWDPANVVRALLRAATASNPRAQYIVGGDAKFLLYPLLSLPSPLVEELTYALLYTRMVPACLREKQQPQLQPEAAPAPAPSKEEQQHQQAGEGRAPIAG